MSRLDLTLAPKTPAARRSEVIDGAGGRRRWFEEEKARAIEESLPPGAVVSQVARRHALTPQQMFTWPREAQQQAAALIDVLRASGQSPKLLSRTVFSQFHRCGHARISFAHNESEIPRLGNSPMSQPAQPLVF